MSNEKTMPVSSRCSMCPHHRTVDITVSDNLAHGHYQRSFCAAEMPHTEVQNECARDEITLWVAQHYAGERPDEAIAWLLGWANLRHKQVLGRLEQALLEVAGAELASVAWPVQATKPENVIGELREQVEIDERTIRALQVEAVAALRFAGLLQETKCRVTRHAADSASRSSDREAQ